MENPPRPDRSSGKVVFKEKKGGGGKQIESYPVGQTIENLNALIRDKYEKEKKKAKAAGNTDAEKSAFAEATKLPQLNAVKHWQDNMAEIKLKKALEKMMDDQEIPGLLIRSVKLDQISALNDLGLKLPLSKKTDKGTVTFEVAGEIDLLMAYLSDGFLHVHIF